MTRTTKPGYVYCPPANYRGNRKYPFEMLVEGECIDPPYAANDLAKVKFAVSRWRRLHGDPLTISHTDAGLVVGWAMGAERVTPREVTKRGPKLAKPPKTGPRKTSAAPQS
jgi:hypothetical protein